MLVYIFQCLLVLERLSVWLSGGQELCVWNEDFQLQCHRQNHSDNGEIVTINPLSRLTVAPLFAHKLINAVFFLFWHFAGITALLELPKNCVAGAMDKEISKKMRTKNK